MEVLDVRSFAAIQLRLTRARLRAALEASNRAERDAEARFAWLEACRTHEASFLSTTTETEATPMSRLRARLGLSATEERVLWVLIAHELCPQARQLVRDLNSETTPDPTLDTLRRAVYGLEPDVHAWRELAANGRLRRSCLIERIDSGDVC